MEAMEDHGYICLNTDTLTRMGDNNQRSSNIDLILCTHDVPDIVDYQQGEDPWGSDRFPLILEIKTSRITYHKITNRLSTKKTDCEEYHKWMDQKIKQLREEIDTSNNFETKYETFVAYMKAAIFKASNKKIEYKQIMNTINMKPEENSKTVKDIYIYIYITKTKVIIKKAKIIHGGIKNVKK